ncbi:MAG: hypothetical protein IJV69_03220 [Kiritimatiellae bacterium]|nr:hypothetical protein [Kiritimatiellia bacterium]
MCAVFDSLDALPANAALAVGTFDGVHKGHQAILNAMTAFAHATGRAPWVLSFASPPTALLNPSANKGAIYDAVLQASYLQQTGASFIRQPFDSAFAARTAEAFLVSLRQAVIFCGKDWRFGKGAEGDVRFLEAHHACVHVVPDVDYEGERISSTRIRQAIQAGALDSVAAMLGRPWEFVGVVQHGRALAGKVFGVPTLNIPYIGRFGEPLLPLAHGVYCGEATVIRKGEVLQTASALINFGIAPSVKNEKVPLFEVHLLDTVGDFYGAEVILRIHHPRLRPEKKFDSLDMLKAQIHDDLVRCRSVLNQ